MATVVRDFPRAVRVIENSVDHARGRHPPGGQDLAARGRRRRPGAGRARVPALPQARRHRCARPAAVPLPGRPRLRRGARRPARPRRLRRPARGRVHAPGAGRRSRGDRLDRRAAVVHRGGGDARHLLGRVQQPPDRRPAPAGAAGDHHALLDRRPLHRRRALQGRAGAGPGHAALGHLHAAGERRAARSRDGGRGSLARPVAGPHRRVPAAGRDLAGAPASRRLLEAGLGDRGLLGDHRRGLRRRRLAGRLHQCRPAPARGPQLPPQGADRAVGPRLAAERHAAARDRLPAGVPALVGSLAEGDRQRHHAGADAARLGAGLGATGAHASRAAGPVGERRRLAAAGLGAATCTWEIARCWTSPGRRRSSGSWGARPAGWTAVPGAARARRPTTPTTSAPRTACR